jgi:hypothetical protein
VLPSYLLISFEFVAALVPEEDDSKLVLSELKL